MSRRPLRFPIVLTINGEDLTFIGRDMPVGWFFQGFPDVIPMTDCYGKAGSEGQARISRELEAWQDQILCRGVWLLEDDAHARRLTPELVQRLGDQRDPAVLAYLSAVGWFTPEDKGYTVHTAPLPRASCADPLAAAEQRAAMTRIPGHNILSMVMDVARYSSVASHTVWRRWWISEFIWTWRLCPKGQLGAERARRSRLPDDMAHIGVEVG